MSLNLIRIIHGNVNLKAKLRISGFEAAAVNRKTLRYVSKSWNTYTSVKTVNITTKINFGITILNIVNFFNVIFKIFLLQIFNLCLINECMAFKLVSFTILNWYIFSYININKKAFIVFNFNFIYF